MTDLEKVEFAVRQTLEKFEYTLDYNVKDWFAKLAEELGKINHDHNKTQP